MANMKKSAAAWSFAGVLAGFAGLAVAKLVAALVNLPGPVTVVADLLRDSVPGDVANWARENSGKAITIPSIVIVLVLVFALIGLLARKAWWMPVAGFAAIGAIGIWAYLSENGATTVSVLPIVVGYAAMIGSLAGMTDRLRRMADLGEDQTFTPVWRGRRRDFLVVSAAVAGTAALSGFLAKLANRDVAAVKQEQRLLKLPTTAPVLPEGVRIDVDGVRPWMTPAEDFYLIDTSFVKPAIQVKDWQLRIHGMVDREVVLSYDDLVDRDFVEQWVTLNCVSNEVGGDLIGNAWWSGVLLAPILAEAGVQEGADAVLQTSHDGWNCATPIEALTDTDRQAMLAVAMNGKPLPIEHGYPVRTLVPGLYGYVSGTKWVVDMEVTRFDEVDAYWTQRGWSELGPVKMASRIDVPRYGAEVASGEVVVAGAAWSQHTGISAVEVQVDGGAWTACDLGDVPSDDTWVQWKATLDLEPGEHTVYVRATDSDGLVQTSAVADVLPDGSTGWHSVSFDAT